MQKCRHPDSELGYCSPRSIYHAPGYFPRRCCRQLREADTLHEEEQVMATLCLLMALHYSGQLHREVIERLKGELNGVNTTTVWPTFNPPSHSGPDVITYGDSGFKRFSAGVLYYSISFILFHFPPIAQLAEDVLSPSDILVDPPPEIAPLLATFKFKPQIQ